MMGFSARSRSFVVFWPNKDDEQCHFRPRRLGPGVPKSAPELGSFCQKLGSFCPKRVAKLGLFCAQVWDEGKGEVQDFASFMCDFGRLCSCFIAKSSKIGFVRSKEALKIGLFGLEALRQNWVCSVITG